MQALQANVPHGGIEHIPTEVPDPQQVITGLEYDDRGNVTTVQAGGSTVVTRSYNADGTVATQTDGKGAVDFIGDNRTLAGRALNRRIELTVTAK